MPCFVLLHLLFAITFDHVLLVPPQGQLLLFHDTLCTQPLAIDSSKFLAIIICLPTPGVSGIVVQSQPSCTLSNATLTAYEDTACVSVVGADLSLSLFPVMIV